jgi:hypothetical protein
LEHPEKGEFGRSKKYSSEKEKLRRCQKHSSSSAFGLRPSMKVTKNIYVEKEENAIHLGGIQEVVFQFIMKIFIQKKRE